MKGRSFARWLLALGLLVVAVPLSTAGCGGSSGAPNCGAEQPCGGDVVGTWNFVGTCSNVKAASADEATTCPGASIDSASATLTGAITFNADQTYTATSWHETFAGVETVPLACDTTVTSCAALGGTVSDSANGKSISITTTCTGTTVCTCRVTGTLTLGSEDSTYTVSGTTLQMTGPATSGTFPYCVEADRLHLMQLSTTMVTPMGQAVITSDLVAKKQ